MLADCLQLIVKYSSFQFGTVPVDHDIFILRGYQRILRNIDAAHLGKFTRQFVHDAAAVHIFVSASAAQNQAAAVLYILFQHCFSLIGDQHRMRVEQYGIRFQIFCGYIVAQIDIIHRCVSSLCSFENTKLALPLYLFMPYIKLAVPYVVVIFQETNFCLVFGTCDLRQFLEFLVNRFYFCQSAIVSSGIIQDTVPVDFCSIGTRSPTEIADIISTVCNALHGPQCHLSRFRCWSCHTGIPSIGTGLLFHDTEVFGYGTNLRQVTAPHTVFQEVVRFVCIQAVSEVRVGIIHDEIQTLVCHSLVVQVAEQTVGGDKITRFQIFADDIALQFCKFACTVGYKSCIIQYFMRIGIVAQRRSWNMYFLEAVVRLVPEIGSPCIIQCIDASIFFHQEFTECNGITFGIELIFLAVDLVVDLPSDDCRMFCIMRCGFFHNDSGQLLIFRGIVIVVSSSAMAVQNTIHGRIQNFRIFFGQPCRRCRCRSTKDYFHTHFRCCIQKSVKEIIVENTFVPLNLTPCKFCDSNYFDAVFQHSS